MRDIGVSFVVPVYNKASHLDQVLRQIARQQGDFPRQYIFIDDGSTDGSLAVLRARTKGWDDLVIESQANKGSAGATNRGIALARHPYIKFVDADDLLSDNATQVLLDALHDTPACLAYGGIEHYRDLADIDLSPRVDDPVVETIDRPLRLAIKNSLFNPTQCLARTAAVREVGGCDERIVHSQEYSLTLRLARKWPLIKVHAPVAFAPVRTEGRLSDDEGLQLQRVTRALAYFLRDHPDMPWTMRRIACRRAAGRAWKFVRRNRKPPTLTSRWFWRNLFTLLALARKDAAFIDACCEAFDAAAPLDPDGPRTAKG